MPDLTLSLPRFRYHPDPLGTGSVEPSKGTCSRCGEARGFLYTEPLLADTEPSPRICPWCLADGSARAELGAEFFDPEAVGGRGRWPEVPAAIREEIAYRTPGFSGWGDELWWTCCGDAGLFLGPAGRTELTRFGPELELSLQREHGLTPEEWIHVRESLDREKGPTAYVFRCAHCDQLGGYVDTPG